MSNTFKGGIHPFGGKGLTKDKAPTGIKARRGACISREVCMPVRLLLPVVKPGDEVLAGQVIAEASSTVSANIHSSVSGTVKKVEMRPLPTGGKAMSIVIENDGEYREVEYITSDPESTFKRRDP